ncbi:nucleoside phosphorylase domain-containing protein [Dactylonectria macrodidyma]|uniref:Nucleoside phosphorylase domain-containing protein n=1 Tax=Dactylonectria macrodidyma TaxID=307937 RepID=A0A9P9FU20_9HYPO|nr:nucleoside phosphorylase domain-containing protein [Dactylonectria macrodidyma]
MDHNCTSARGVHISFWRSWQCDKLYFEDFEIAIICALKIEADAIEAVFDEHWDDDWPCYGKAAADSNAYITGSIGPTSTNPHARHGQAIVMGEIVLGDVIVSDGIIQYDLRRRHPDRLERKDTLLDSLGRPNTEIHGLLAKLRGIRGRKTLLNHMSSYLDELRKETELKAEYPGTQNDKLFRAACHHASCSIVCQMSECRDQPVFRHGLAQDAPQPAVHFGLIASGDTVVKSGEERDMISQRENVVGFEMEGAGVWDIFPCVVIKGACDYADSPATAVSCAKGFLNHWVPSVRDGK